MKKWIPLAVVLVATAAAAFLIGRSSAAPAEGLSRPDRDAATEAELARLREENARLRSAPPAPASAPAAGEEGGDVTRATAPGMRPVVLPAAGEGGTVGPRPDLAGVTDVREASARLMAFADAQLERGDEGYLVLLETLSELEKSEELRRLAQDEAAVIPELYPWLRFLMDRDAKVADMTEWVFRTMAEEPERLAPVDDDPLELFTEGFGMMLPGAVTEDRLAAFRGYAEKILATPEDRQPDSVRQNRQRIERLLGRYWAEPIPLDRAVEMLKTGELALDSPQARDLVRRIPPEAWAELDVPGLLGPLAESGRYEAIMVLQRLPEGTLRSDVLDASVLRGLDEGTVNAGFLMQYLRTTDRHAWSKAQVFLERALAGTPASRAQAVQFLAYLPAGERPDKQYVIDLLARTELDENVRTWLKRAYGID